MVSDTFSMDQIIGQSAATISPIILSTSSTPYTAPSSPNLNLKKPHINNSSFNNNGYSGYYFYYNNNNNNDKIKLQCEIYGFQRFLTCVNSNITVLNLIKILEEEIKINYNLITKILFINDSTHTKLSNDSILKQVLKPLQQIYLFVTCPKP